MSPCIATRFRVRDLNDAFRRAGPLSGGRWVLTRGVSDLGADFVALAMEAVRGFDGFTSGMIPTRSTISGRSILAA